MGLLDTLFQNPDTATAMGLLGTGMMAGNAPQGFAQAFGAFDAGPERRLKQQLTQAQLDNFASEIEQRKQAVAKQAQLQDMLKGMFGAGGDISAPQVSPGAFTPSLNGMGPTMPPSMAAQSQPGSRLAGLGIDQIAALKAAGGPDLMDAYKWVKDPLKMEQGSTYVDRATGKERFMAKVDPGIAPDGNGFYAPLPGYASAQGQLAGATADAQEQAKAKLDLVKVTGADGAERYVPRSQVAAQAQSAPPPQARPITPEPPPTGNFVGDPKMVAQAISEIKDPTQRAQASQAYQQQYGQLPGAYQATPTNEQAAAAAAQKASLTTTAEKTAADVAEQRKSIMNAGFTAPSNIAKYQQLGTLLANVDGGKLTQSGTNIASAMNSLGIKIDKNLPNKEAAAALGNQMALELRSPAGGAGMPGALSDKDREFLQGMVPNAGQTTQGRKQLIDSYVALQQRNQQVATFARNYEKKYGRLDNGFFEQMQSWSNAHPLFGSK